MNTSGFSSARRGAPLLVFISLMVAACNDVSTTALPASTSPAVAARTLPEPHSVRFVRLEALSEWNGKPWSTIAEFDLLDSTGALVDRKRWTAKADSAGVSNAPAYAIDGDPKTLWHSAWEGTDPAPPPPHWLMVSLGVPVKVSGFRVLPRQDGTPNGAIARYRFLLSNDGINWGEPVSVGDFAASEGPTLERTVVFAKQTENHAPVATTPAAQSGPMGLAASAQVTASDTDGDRLAYSASGLPPGLKISSTTGLIDGTPIKPGDYTVNVSVSDGKGLPATIAFQWTVGAPPAVESVAKLAPGQVRFVRLEEVTAADGQPWASMAEFNLVDATGATLPREGWIASADSADISDKPGNAIDGLPNTVWHTQWDGASPPPPHSFIVDLRTGAQVRGFRYLPRQDGLPNGTIGKFRFFTSVDGVEWGKPVAEGDFTAMGPAGSEKTVMLR